MIRRPEIESYLSAKVHGLGFALLAVSLTACIPRQQGFDFGRPAPDWLPVGRTTRAEIIARFGEPTVREQFTNNGKIVESLSYEYSRRDVGEPWWVYKYLWCYFSGDTFLGHRFRSALPEGQVDFDEKKLTSVVKGTTTADQIFALFGPPASSYVYPATADKKTGPGDTAVGYFFAARRADVIDFKRLEVTFGPDRVVKDFDFGAEKRPAQEPPKEWTGAVPF
jgi:outer membrane protein assembly factor BamE (lipoprotein component of BamABCDE complex)